MWRTRYAGGLARRSCLPAVIGALAACGSSSTPPPPPVGPVVQSGYAISVRPGVSDFGTGRLALTLLATVRNDAGAGPSVAWDARPHDESGAAVAPQGGYLAPGPGSYVTWTWPSVLVDAPQARAQDRPDTPSTGGIGRGVSEAPEGRRAQCQSRRHHRQR